MTQGIDLRWINEPLTGIEGYPMYLERTHPLLTAKQQGVLLRLSSQ